MLDPIGRPHVFLLGAGASCAAFPDGDKDGRRLPTLDSLVRTVGVERLLQDNGLEVDANFEALYSRLCDTPGTEELRTQLEQAVFSYFASLELPEEPTFYDRMLLSLRPKDVIATFNWDPFLWKACSRLAGRFGPDILPNVLFLHGSVAVGYCLNHEPATMGDVRTPYCRRCGEALSRSRLLYPVAKKDYQADPTIAKSWDMLGRWMQAAFVFTVFGYSAPITDVEAVDLLKSAWGDPGKRNFEQVEIIDIRSPQELYDSWQSFILREHYWTLRTFGESYVAKYPRRSCEHFWQAVGMCDPQDENPIPLEGGWLALEDWLKPLLAQELDARENPKLLMGPARRGTEGDQA
jgi:hypothetical protein